MVLTQPINPPSKLVDQVSQTSIRNWDNVLFRLKKNLIKSDFIWGVRSAFVDMIEQQTLPNLLFL